MKKECTSWPAMLKEAETRIVDYHEANPSSRKFPEPLAYGLINGPNMFVVGEEGVEDGILRIVDEDIARQINDNGDDSFLFDDIDSRY